MDGLGNGTRKEEEFSVKWKDAVRVRCVTGKEADRVKDGTEFSIMIGIDWSVLKRYVLKYRLDNDNDNDIYLNIG